MQSNKGLIDDATTVSHFDGFLANFDELVQKFRDLFTQKHAQLVECTENVKATFEMEKKSFLQEKERAREAEATLRRELEAAQLEEKGLADEIKVMKDLEKTLKARVDRATKVQATLSEGA